MPVLHALHQAVAGAALRRTFPSTLVPFTTLSTTMYVNYVSRVVMQVFTITVPPQPTQLQAADALVASMSPSARQTYALGGTQKYELPISEVSLSKVRPYREGSVTAFFHQYSMLASVGVGVLGSIEAMTRYADSACCAHRSKGMVACHQRCYADHSPRLARV